MSSIFYIKTINNHFSESIKGQNTWFCLFLKTDMKYLHCHDARTSVVACIASWESKDLNIKINNTKWNKAMWCGYWRHNNEP